MPDIPERVKGSPDDELKNILSKVFSVLGGEESGYKIDVPGGSIKDVIDSISGGMGVSIINLDRKYEFGDEPRLVMDERGSLADWRDRFERPGHVFRPGERVLVPAFAEVGENGETVLVADDQDGRMADRFHPLNVSGDAKTILDRYLGAAVGCVIRVEGLKKTDFQISDIHEYDVELEPELIVPPINPTIEQFQQLPRGARTILEGRVVDFGSRREKTRFGTTAMTAYLTIETHDGRSISVESLADKLAYKGGVLENLDGKQLELDEQVRLASYIGVNKAGEKTINSHWAQPYLVKPSQQRLVDYERLRDEVTGATGRMVEFIDENRWQEARQLFAEARTSELTASEGERLSFLLSRFPNGERPVFDGKRRLYWAESLDKAFNVRTEALTKKELVQFAREVGTGQRTQIGPHCDGSYAFFLMHQNDIGHETALSVLVTSADQRLTRLEQVEDEHDASFEEHYMLEQTLGYMAGVPLPEATAKILDVARYCMRNKLYDKRQERIDDWQCPHKFLHLLWSAADDLVHSIQQHPENINAITNLDELLAWQNELSRYPFCDTIVDNLRKVTDSFKL